MKVNLDINNRDKTIEFHYKHAKGWHVNYAKWVLNDCIINADEYEERILCSNKDSLNMIVEFNNCTFNLYRSTLALYYGSGIIFNNCKFIFNDKNTSENRVVLNQSGYVMKDVLGILMIVILKVNTLLKYIIVN